MGVFVFIGATPNSKLISQFTKLEKGYIVTDGEMRTSIPGVFAAGDVRVTPVRQIVTSASDGAIASISAEKYISENF